MQIVQDTYHYHDDAQVLDLGKKISDHIHLKISLHFLTTEFLHSQQDLVQEFVGNLAEQTQDLQHDTDAIRQVLETQIKELNNQLKAFADKIDKVEYFHIKGCIQVIADNVLMTSMIGDTSVMIFRNNRLYYSLHNTLDHPEKIDVFADFIEGDVEYHDRIVYVGTKVADVLDDTDVATIENALADNAADFLLELKSLLESRIEKTRINFISAYLLRGSMDGMTAKKGKKLKLPTIKIGSKLGSIAKRGQLFSFNKYYLVVTVGGLVVLFLLYQVFSGLLNTQNNDVILTDDGVLVDVTIDDIKKEIQLFQSLDPISDEKSQTYHSIIQKLDALEQRGRRLEDVSQLRKIVQVDYNRGFNIIYVSNLDQFNDPTSDYTSNFMTFNNAEINALGTLKTIDYTRELMIGGTDAVLIGALNNSVRGTLIDYGLDGIVKGCNLNLLRDGVYCYGDDTIFMVNKEGVQTVSTTDENGLPSDIDEVAVYGKSNLYVFHKNFATAGTGSTFVTRYRNNVGSQAQFQEGQTSAVLGASLPSNTSFSQGFSDYVIDGSFIAWSRTDAKLYQFRREGASSLLSARAIPMLGGDKATSAYSANIKVIASLGSRYVYLFDRDNQTFTLYTSNPTKENDAYGREFSLQYLFRFTFDLSDTTVIDIDVPESTNARPEMYLLTDKGVQRVKLYEFIDSLASGTLKQL